MASSRKPNSADLVQLVDDRLGAAVAPGARVLLGLSGGVDSVVLFDILCALAPLRRFVLSVLHVNHGLSPNASQWALFCEALCRAKAVPFTVEAVDLKPHASLGIEGAARQARYEAFARHASGIVVVAQHRDDQAETLLLHLLRGSGARGLSAMPYERQLRGSEARLVRPLLDAAREQIEAYASANRLEWIDDESNADLGLRRNFLRRNVLPVLRVAFPEAGAALARSAAGLAETSMLMDQLGDEDLARIALPEGVNAEKLLGLGEARARNALRRWTEAQDLPWAGTARLTELLRQLSCAGTHAQLEVALGDWSFRYYRGVLYLEVSRDLPQGLCREWKGEAEMVLPGHTGILRFVPSMGRGLDASKIRQCCLTVQFRHGGERLQLDCTRPHRTLKNLFQEHGVPPWRRVHMPLLYCGEELISIPNIGESCTWRAGPGEAGVLVTWHASPAAAPPG